MTFPGVHSASRGPPLTPRVLLLVEQRHWLAAACLPPLLREGGMRVDVICRPGSLISKSRFVDQVTLVDGGEDAYFEAVGRFLMANRDRYVWVVPVTDTDIRGLAVRLDQPWVASIFPAHQSREVIEALLDKPAMDRLLRRAGVMLPASAPVATPWELIEFGDKAGWPVILKPIDGVGGGGVARVRAAEQAVAAMMVVSPDYPALMAQAFIPGPVASCQVVYDRGEPLAWATSYKTRTWPVPYGPSCAVTFAPIQGVDEQLPLIGRALGFHGALTIDLIVDERSAQPVIIEVNARPAGLMSRGRRAGVDFAGALRQLLVGAGVSKHTRGTRRSFIAGLYPQDLVRCIEEGEVAPLRDWFRFDTLADLPWTDPRVFLSNTRFLLSRLVRRA